MLMERMKLLQESQLEEEGVTQEEMATRFELEKTESLLVTPSGEEVQGCSWLRTGSQRVGAGGRSQRLPREEQDQAPSCRVGSVWDHTASLTAAAVVPCRSCGSLPAVQRPLLRGGPRVQLQGLHAEG